MSVLAKVNQPAVSLAEVKQPEVKNADATRHNIVIISSRKLDEEERKILSLHEKGLKDFDERYSSLSVSEIFQQLDCSFLVFQLVEHDDKAYVMNHYEELKGFTIIALKSKLEKYDEDWITDLKNLGCVVLKAIDLQTVKDSEFFNQILHHVHVHSPPSCLALVLRFLGKLLGSA